MYFFVFKMWDTLNLGNCSFWVKIDNNFINSAARVVKVVLVHYYQDGNIHKSKAKQTVRYRNNIKYRVSVL